MSRGRSADELSVVIPARNAARFLGDCLRSVLDQSAPAGEVVVVDDHSDDGTADVARSFGDAVRVLTNPGRGVASALNHGIGSARGRLIAHFDADDLMRPDKLARQLAVYQSSRGGRVGFVGSDLRMFDERGADPVTFLEGRPRFRAAHPRDGGAVIWLEPAEATHALCHEYCVDIKGIYPRSVWQEVGGFDTSMVCVNDMDFLWKVARRHPIALVDEVLIDGRRHATNLSRDGRLVAEECVRLFRRMLACELTDEDRQAVRRRVVREHYDLAHLHRASARYPQSVLEYLKFALRVA